MKNRSWTPLGRDPHTGAQIFKAGSLVVLVSRDADRWHLSISRPDKYSTWDEIADARYDLMPNEIEVAMLLPPPAHYVNQHPYVFHLWEIVDPDLPIERQPTGLRRSRETVYASPGQESRTS